MSYSAEVLADSPSVWWRLGESSGTTAADSSGNSRAGTYTGSPTLGATGALAGDSNTAMTVTADSGQRVTIADAAWMHTSTMSVEAWVKFSSAFDSTNGDAIVSKYATGGFQFLLWRNTTNNLAIQFANTTPTAFNVVDAGNPTLGVWYHVVATMDGSNCRLYINGSLIASLPNVVPFSGTLGTGGTNPLEVGRYSANNATTPGATIDEVAIYYGTALSADRILAHYAAGTNTVTGSAALSLSASNGVASASATASLSLSASGGVAPAGRTGTAALTLTASASGPSGSGTASLSLSASASSTAPASSTATLTLTASESAPNAAGGTATLTLTAGGVAVALFTTDLSNAFDGLDLVCMATVTLTRPPAPVPPTLVQAVRYEKAVPYRAPVMVGGRPT